MKAFLRLAQRWQLPRKSWPTILSRSARALDGWVSEIASNKEAKLDSDVEERLSHLIAIYDGLHRLFGDPAYADAWIRTPNRAFGGQQPIDKMLTGTFADLYEVRQYIERALAA